MQRTSAVDRDAAILALVGRQEPLFTADLQRHGVAMDEAVRGARFLVIGGAGSIGAAVVRELFQRKPAVLHVVDISENNLAEVVRDIRSSMGYIDGDFRTFAIDCGSVEFDAMAAAHGPYDYVLNLSALKHVRSEKDPFTLMRMIQVNIFNTIRVLDHAIAMRAKKYFCVSTDKASFPVSMMGASKRIMEMFLMRAAQSLPASTARFANVAFSDGSLPYSWKLRIAKRQPLAAPDDVRRYFVTESEGALLCLLSTLFGNNRDIFFPKLSEKLNLIKFSDIARRYLRSVGYEPVECASEDEARARIDELASKGQWPCYFSQSDTTGERDFEEFFTEGEQVDWKRFNDIGVVTNQVGWDRATLERFESAIRLMLESKQWTKPQLLDLFNQTLSKFSHKETFKYLDDRM
ncbi:MAG TPA: UDP-N-acetylglucosamine 4,6-dehydratase [Tepidisphaeraceae bacterium]|jgi:FlaA1/EpsC-like NDP-sugar epimerase|nr:UDP-N-acetylglucosamine 4,6-dehydratase [Tepidisphaeraceae bacterium]